MQEAPVHASPSPEEARAALAKILASHVFRAAAGQREFLRYTVEETLKGRGLQIKEYSIGIEVFHRGPSFDPRQSSIVRSEARNLRASLTKYYSGEGEQDPVRIEFVKGSYTPTFRFSAAARSSLGATEFSPKRGAWRWAAAVSAGIAVLAGLAAFFWQTSHKVPAERAALSIAVLPFANLNPGQDDSFSDGLTDDLIASLTRVPGLRVVARTSSFQYKGKTMDVRRIGMELSVRAVLAGSIRRSGDRLRITVQLSDASDGLSLWSRSYDRELNSSLAIQREISQNIVSSLGLQPSARSRRRLVGSDATSAISAEAYETYVKGRYFLAKDAPQTAIEYFRQTISAEPNFAQGYVGIAHGYTMLPILTGTPSREVTPRIRAAAAKALQLDPDLGEAHIDLARAFSFDFDWHRAEQEFKKGLELEPGDALGHRWYGAYLTKVGRQDDALKEFQLALSLDPVSPSATQTAGMPLYFTRHYPEAIAQFRKALLLEPNFGMTHQMMGMAYLMDGRYSEGVAETQAARNILPANPLTTGQLGYAYAVSGDRESALQLLNAALDQAHRGAFPAFAIAHIYIGLGERDQAFKWLRKAVEDRDVELSLKVDPIYDSLRSDPRFRDLLRRTNLAL